MGMQQFHLRLCSILMALICSVIFAQDDVPTEHIQRFISEYFQKKPMQASPEVVHQIAMGFSTIFASVKKPCNLGWYCEKIAFRLDVFKDPSLITPEIASFVNDAKFQAHASADIEEYPGDAVCEALEARLRSTHRAIYAALREIVKESPAIMIEKSGEMLVADALKACGTLELNCNYGDNLSREDLGKLSRRFARAHLELILNDGLKALETSDMKMAHRYTWDVFNVRFIRDRIVDEKELDANIQRLREEFRGKNVALRGTSQFFLFANFVAADLSLKPPYANLSAELDEIRAEKKRAAESPGDFISFEKDVDADNAQP